MEKAGTCGEQVPAFSFYRRLGEGKEGRKEEWRNGGMEEGVAPVTVKLFGCLPRELPRQEISYHKLTFWSMGDFVGLRTS